MNDSRDASQLFFNFQADIYRPYLVVQNNGRNIAIRSGEWKWIPAQSNQNEELYNLKNDPSELHNVMPAYWKIALDLKRQVSELSQIRNKE